MVPTYDPPIQVAYTITNISDCVNRYWAKSFNIILTNKQINNKLTSLVISLSRQAASHSGSRGSFRGTTDTSSSPIKACKISWKM